MKFIHTSDWHIGKAIHEVSLLEDQKIVLKEFLNILDIEKPDAVIIAGDLYDRAVPSKEAVNALDDVLNEIVMQKKIPVLCIAGNHDSGERLEFSSRILEQNGLHIEGKLKQEIKKIHFNDAYGTINFYLLPFSYVSEIQSCFKTDTIKNFDDAYGVILDLIYETMNPKERHVLITHGFIVSGTEAMEVEESVRPLSVGTTEYVDVEHFKNFDYTALGHLHKPQKVKWEHVRYSGSLLKYSFSEVNQPKSVTVVEMKDKGDVLVKTIPLKAAKDMVKLEGSLQELIQMEQQKAELFSDYTMVVLTDENPIYDAIGQLRAVYPNILRMEYKNRSSASKENLNLQYAQKDKKSDSQMFEDFYVDMTGRIFGEDKRKIITGIFETILTDRGDQA